MSKAVAQYNGKELLAKYTSIANAAFLSEAQPAHIGKVASGIRTTAGGYSWKFTNSTDRLSKGVSGIRQLDAETGELLAVYRDVTTASAMSGLSESQISKVLAGSRRTVDGYTFTV